MELALGGQETMANFSFSLSRADSSTDSDAVNASQFYISIMNDLCIKNFRESYDRIGWLWEEDRSSVEIENLYRESLPLISAVVYIAILLTKEE